MPGTLLWPAKRVGVTENDRNVDNETCPDRLKIALVNIENGVGTCSATAALALVCRQQADAWKKNLK